MNSRLSLLMVVAGVQMLVIGGLLLASTTSSNTDLDLFLSFESAQINRVELSDGVDSGISLTRSEGEWALDGGMPVNAEKLSGVLSKLQELKRPWPVATTSTTQDRFEVSEKKHQRHVQLYMDDDVVADFYLGTSPGYRRVHARQVGDDDILSIDFSNYEIPMAVDDWLDKTLLGSNGEVTEIAREGAWRLKKGEEGWLLDGVAANQEVADRLSGRFADLRIMGLLTDPDDTATTAEGVEHRATFQVTDSGGQQSLEVFHRTEEDDYLIRGDRVTGTFTLASYIAEQIIVEGEDLAVEIEALTDDITTTD